MVEYKFKTYKAAARKASSMKRTYGYRPAVFELRKKRSHFYAVVKPKGLRRIR